MMDRLESSEPEVIAVMAWNLQADQKIVQRIRDAINVKELEVNGLKTLGASLYAYNSEKLKLTVGLECSQENIAREAEKVFKKIVDDIAPAIGLYLGGLKIDVEGGSGGNSPGGADGPPGIGSLGGDAPPSGKPGGGSGRAPRGGDNPGGNNDDPKSKVGVSRKGRVLLFNGDFNFTVRAYNRMSPLTESMVVRMKGLVDMANTQPHWFELAAAAVERRKMADKDKPKDTIPEGTYPRGGAGSTLTRTWAPNQRVSWMAGLLPFLGQEDLARLIVKEKSWRDDENLKVGAVLVPQFVDPTYPPSSWRARVPTLGVRDLGATHFVGMAGVGLNAADYDPKNEATRKKLGVFGYDRQTNVKDITDGLANTIYILQVPDTFPRPWIAGGGATVEGVPETNSLRPFVRTHANGKRGTYALMCDGSVRFIAESMSDDAFKALCTMQGAEEFDVNTVAPKVAPPRGAEMKTAGAGSGGTVGGK
jgi:hypothetical protein